MTSRWNESWTEYCCSDCNPDVDRTLGEQPRHAKPYVLVIPAGEEVPEFCPRCGGYRSLLEGETGLRITNTAAERWAAKP